MNKYISITIVLLLVVFSGWLIRRNISQKTAEIDALQNTQEQEKISAQNSDNDKNIINLEDKKVMNATLNTNEGNITIEFFKEQAPDTVANFIKLAQGNFYDGIKFHRVIKGFMIQGGDPLTRNDTKTAFWGTGGPGYKFADEIDPKSDLYAKIGYKKGIVAMANSGPNTNGSQFFIMNEDYPLPPLYTIFGKVISGQDVVDKIALVKTGENDRPIEPVIINSITLK